MHPIRDQALPPHIPQMRGCQTELTVTVQGDDVPGLEHLDEEAVVVEVDAHGEHAVERRVKLDGLLLLQTLLVKLVDQALGGFLGKTRTKIQK